MSSYLQLSTFLTWMICLAGGALGMLIPYARPRQAPPEPPAIQAQALQVELSPETAEPLAREILKPAEVAPVPPAVLEAPAAPPMLAVAEPSAAIAFALPIEGPARVVEKTQASFAKADNLPPAATSAAAPIKSLTYGLGEGKQPAPEYPYKAMKEGQEGSVLVQFTVNEAGKVISAEIGGASPWFLLNQAALKVIKERWQFQRGAMRRYEVSIRFQLK
jgi:protein TonB